MLFLSSEGFEGKVGDSVSTTELHRLEITHYLAFVEN